MFNEHKKFPKIRGFHNVVKEVKYLEGAGIAPVLSFRPKIKLHGCVDSETLVAMHDGSSKKISDLSIGDKILSFNENNGIIQSDYVENVIKKELHKEWLELSFSNGSSIRCTSCHPIYTKNRGYVPAAELTEKDDLVGCF